MAERLSRQHIRGGGGEGLIHFWNGSADVKQFSQTSTNFFFRPQIISCPVSERTMTYKKYQTQNNLAYPKFWTTDSTLAPPFQKLRSPLPPPSLATYSMLFFLLRNISGTVCHKTKSSASLISRCSSLIIFLSFLNCG